MIDISRIENHVSAASSYASTIEFILAPGMLHAKVYFEGGYAQDYVWDLDFLFQSKSPNDIITNTLIDIIERFYGSQNNDD